MSNLITINKMTSMEIAEVTGKQHGHVMRDIADEIDKLKTAMVDTQSKFGLSERQDSTGRTIPYYELTKEGVLQLAARYDAVVRAKLIDLAMRQEKQLPTNYKEALLALVAAEEEKESLQLQRSVLATENKLLAQETLTWADRKVIEALVKKVGGKIGYEAAWREFKKELLYAHGINLNSRITNWRNSTGRKTGPKTLDMIEDDELQACLSTATALARHHKVDISEIIHKFGQPA